MVVMVHIFLCVLLLQMTLAEPRSRKQTAPNICQICSFQMWIPVELDWHTVTKVQEFQEWLEAGVKVTRAGIIPESCFILLLIQQRYESVDQITLTLKNSSETKCFLRT